jgi:hypothetical protein
MRAYYILMFIICALDQGAFCRQILSGNADQEPLFTDVTVKKKNGSHICDTCKVEFVHHADADCSYIITGTGHTPLRFSHLRDSVGSSYPDSKTYSAQVHIISGADFGFSFLPNFMEEKGKRIQLYRNYLGADYKQLEFLITQNGKPIRAWTTIASLGGIDGFVVLGFKRGADRDSYVPWNQTFYAGSFHLAVRDTLEITIRNSLTKKIVQTISIFRAEDKATGFVYYQVPLTSTSFSLNLQNVLNISAVPMKVYGGDTLSVFEKDYASIGLLRFLGLGKNEQLQYSFKNTPYSWHTLSSINSENGIFLVLGNDMKAGEDQDIYLRFETQPETIHKITIKVRQKPFDISWKTIAGLSIILLAGAGIAFYLWHTRSKRRLAALRQKSEDTEARLALLSGQLNPHFLFNSLNAIQGTINNGDQERVSTYIGNVAGFMRDVMDNGRKEFISLQEELKMEADYLKLENERKAFSYTLNIAEGLEAMLIDIPPLLLQPVLENSVRHAFGQDHPNPALSIEVSSVVHNLIVKVSDNGSIPWNTNGTQYGHGLSLTRKRIAVYNEKLEGMSVQMEINYVRGSGTITIFTFQDWLA